MDAISVDTRQGMELREYLDVLRRRKKSIIIPFILISVLAVILAAVLPTEYRSSVTILIEGQEVPEELISSTSSTMAEALGQRVQQVMLRLLTQENLWPIIEELNLYPEERAESTPEQAPEQVVGLMRSSIEIEVIDFQATQSESKTLVTTALQVSFISADPVLAERVANRLGKLFVEENRKQRAGSAALVSRFLGGEGEKLRLDIVELEKRLATFKKKNVNNLPELKDFNLRLYEQTEDRIARVDEAIRSLEDRKLKLQGQLAITDPYKEIYTDEGRRLQSANERLRALMTDYLRLSSTYSPDHPDIRRLQREIGSLEGQLGTNESVVVSIIKKLTLLRGKLSEARQKYSEDHPDVKKLKQSVASLEGELSNHALPAGGVGTGGEPVAPDNPSYVSLKTQMDTIVANLNAKFAERSQLNMKLEDYKRRLMRTPIVEREYLSLSRDYENAVQKYKELKDKELEARMGYELESSNKGNRFTIVEPAQIPGKPYRPNRPAIILIGMVLGLISGIGAATVAEYMDRTIRGKRGVQRAFGAPPLATIPYIPDLRT
jgi:succinoglycan biosynthesis transport protein ExoP